MRAATYSQRFRFKRVTLVQQEYHKNISSSRGFCRFFEKKCKKIKIPCSKSVSQVQQAQPGSRKFVTPVLHFTVFGIVSSHFTCCILFSTLFLQCFSCIFPYVYSLTCIFQSITDFCVRFFRSTPLPQPFSGLQQAFGCTFCNKKQHRQPFQGHLCCAVFLI